MQIIKLSAMAAAVLATTVFAQFTVAADLQPGKGWDAFNARAGEIVSSDSYMGTSMGTAPGLGYDTMHTGGAPIDSGYQGTAMVASPSQSFDTAHVGSAGY